MQYELEDNHKDYRYISHKEGCDLLSTIEVKKNKKICSPDKETCNIKGVIC